MGPKEGARQVTGLGESTEGRARRRRSGGGRGNSGSGDRVARLAQQAARGGFVVHRGELRCLDERERRLEGGSHRAAPMADGGGSGGSACARGTAGARL
jgi:hypothetical protein